MKHMWIAQIDRTKRIILPAGVVALAVVAVAAGQSRPMDTKLTATDTQPVQTESPATETPAPTATPTITIDGKAVASNDDGSTSIVTNSGTTVTSTNGHTVVTTTDDAKRGDTSNQKAGNVSVRLDSNSNGGTSQTSVRSFGLDASNDNSSTSFSSTSVFSTGGDHVTVSR